MDVTPYLELKIAPRAIFDNLAQRQSRVRFMIPDGKGEWEAITWGAFAKEIREIALFLNALGLAPEARGVVFAPNRVEWLSAALAIQAAGGAMVPVYPNSTVDQAAYIIEHSDAQVLFVDTAALLGRVYQAWERYADVKRIVLLDNGIDPFEILTKLHMKGVKVPSVTEIETRIVSWKHARAVGAAYDLEHPGRFEEVMYGVDLEQIGLMLYTSGTTGRPKGVPLTHMNIGTNGRDWLLNNGPLLEEGYVDPLWLPMSHIYGFGEACLGNTLNFVSYLCTPLDVLPLLPKIRPNIFMSVPRYWEKIAQLSGMGQGQEREMALLKEATGGQLRFCLSGGAGLKEEIKTFFYNHDLLIIEGYGLTEASPTLTMNRPDDFRFDTVGKPMESVELKLAEDGEILAKGPNVFKGYHKDPEATAGAFTEDGWLKTGDVGRWTEDGFLQIIDRKKEILVTAAGKNVPPANIELRFADKPLFLHLVVYGDAKPYLVAGVWIDPMVAAKLEGDVEALVKEAIEEVNGSLARYETIKKFAIMERPLTVENDLLTTTLKVKRKKVYEAFKETFEALYEG